MTAAVNMQSLQRDIDRTVKKLGGLPGKIGRRSLRRAAAKGGTIVLKKARQQAPRAETGLFSKSLMKKAYTRANKGVYMSIVGQNLKRSGGREGTAGRGFTQRQRHKARRANFGISTGISGTGKAVPIHFTMRPVKRHVINTNRSGKPFLWWNRAKGNIPIPPTRAVWVMHPGRRNPPQWLDDAKTANARPSRSGVLERSRKGTRQGG